MGKSPGIDNVSSELIKEGGPVLTQLLTDLCQKLWSTNKWPDAWTTSLIIPLPKKGDLNNCEKYRTVSLISHSSKILLHIIRGVGTIFVMGGLFISILYYISYYLLPI